MPTPIGTRVISPLLRSVFQVVSVPADDLCYEADCMQDTAMAVAGKNARNVDTFDALTLYPIPTLDIHNQVQGLNAWEHELQKRERNVREREDEIERMIRAREAELRLRERRVARRERAIRRGSEAAMQGRRRSSGSG